MGLYRQSMVLLLLLSTAVLSFSQQAEKIRFAMSKAGVSTLQVHGVSLLADGSFQVLKAQRSNYDGAAVATDMTILRTQVDSRRQRVTQQFTWGVVRCLYQAIGNRLDMTITVKNISEYPLQKIQLQPLTLCFPQVVTSFENDRRKGHNVDSPTVICLDYGSGKLALVNTDIGQPLYVGFKTGIDIKKIDAVFPVVLGTAKDITIYPTHWMDDPIIHRTIYPGVTDSFTISLRFGSTQATYDELSNDIYQRFAQGFPMKLNWTDRRPIGMLHLSSSAMGIVKNPRGWFMNRDLDITTPEGRESLHQQLMNYASTSIKVLKGMNAQGLIVWDVEGQEYPHATSYIGDPRSLPPEIDPYLDEFFQAFRDAGLRVGLCLRPNHPVRLLYKDSALQEQVFDPAYILRDKLAYAKKRWGCTLFYVDSNSDFDARGMYNDEQAYQLMSVKIFKELFENNPDVLLIPEHETVQYYAYCAPYDELRGGYTTTPVHVRRAYPKACSVIMVADGPMDERHDELLAAVKRGDILLFRGWFNDDYNDKVKKLYQEAGE